jgi:hypothetical protein
MRLTKLDSDTMGLGKGRRLFPQKEEDLCSSDHSPKKTAPRREGWRRLECFHYIMVAKEIWFARVAQSGSVPQLVETTRGHLWLVRWSKLTLCQALENVCR